MAFVDFLARLSTTAETQYQIQHQRGRDNASDEDRAKPRPGSPCRGEACGDRAGLLNRSDGAGHPGIIGTPYPEVIDELCVILSGWR